MYAPFYSAADYLAAMQALLPRGRAWPRDPASVQAKTLAGLVAGYAINNARANHLLVDAFPATVQELLPEWEATLALPAPAAGPAPSLAARKTLVLARFIGPGGVSIANYRNYAAVLGFNLSVTPRAPFRCGQSRCGHALGAVEQMFGLTFMLPASAANGTVFAQYGPSVLRTELQRVAPAHSVFTYQIF
jgi:uncharacterized protein YmfQ (DUF2313 family)